MLTDSSRKGRSTPKRRKATDVAKHYSDSQKMEALKLYLATGALTVVSASLNISYKTLQEWRYSKWWDELGKQIKKEGKIQLSNKLRTIAETAMTAVKDRLENGEWVMSPLGELVRKPVSIRDAHVVAKDNLDNAIRLESEQSDGQSNERIEDRLDQLADAFTRFARKTTRIEVLDAIPEEREEGLQEGSQLGEDHSSSPSEAEGGEDGSPEGDAEGGEGIPERQQNGGPQER